MKTDKPGVIPRNLRLADFIVQDMERILIEWESFATQHGPQGIRLDSATLRDHAEEILDAIVLDLRTAQSGYEQDEKSKGHTPSQGGSNTAAQTHAVLRADVGFNIIQMAAEYRALRASVLKLWASNSSQATTNYLEAFTDVGRFNEAIDQALMESVTFFTQEVERKRTLFLAVIGHDLRNPLMTVMASAQALTKLGIEGKGAEIVTRLMRSGARMKHLLDDLLDYNRAALGSTLPIAVAEVDLSEVCALEIESLQSAHADREIRFYAHGDLRGVWDGVRIQQLLSNLLKNAIDYSAREEAIEVRITGRDSEIVLSVHNRGPAIPPATLLHIFEPLTRGKPSQGPEAATSTNLGLGLFITQEIARAHGGSVHVSSDEHETIFTLYLPR